MLPRVRSQASSLSRVWKYPGFTIRFLTYRCSSWLPRRPARRIGYEVTPLCCSCANNSSRMQMVPASATHATTIRSPHGEVLRRIPLRSHATYRQYLAHHMSIRAQMEEWGNTLPAAATREMRRSVRSGAGTFRNWRITGHHLITALVRGCQNEQFVEGQLGIQNHECVTFPITNVP